MSDRDRMRSRSKAIPGGNVLSRALDHLEEWLIAALIAVATVLIFLAVLHRYGAGVSIDSSKWATAHGFTALAAFLKSIFLWLAALDVSWAQELCIYMFIWMAKFGAAYGVRTGIHVGVDVLVNILPASSRRRVITFSLLCGALFTASLRRSVPPLSPRCGTRANSPTISKCRCGSFIWRSRSVRV